MAYPPTSKRDSDSAYIHVVVPAAGLPAEGQRGRHEAYIGGERCVHKAPANELVMGITGLSQNINRLEQGQYNERGINVIRIFKDRGIRVWGARTHDFRSRIGAQWGDIG